MDPTNYYVATLTNAAVKLGPILAFIVVGWLIFVKLPFFFFLRSMGHNKKKFDEVPDKKVEDYTVDNYKDFQRRMTVLKTGKEAPKIGMEGPKASGNRKEERKQEKKEEKQQERLRQQAPPKREELQFNWACEIFDMKRGQKISKEELRKRYHELLRKNHPDKVASLGPEFKKLADRKTKEINQAYNALKVKAS